ncbi:uncharacterized protein LOC127840437 [Dreissena polymorpha]|uniref:uncharacterized protein LOC127840437 n=1 Tax=Dreissena polymorpha TaxID=45954 RepID=UPI002263BCD8|nr:uncharacterized protein LOC127840437 [Dreissena polymorpha]
MAANMRLSISLLQLALIPLEASKFTPIPQRLRFWKLPASLNTAIFHTDFGSLAAADFDTNYPASLEFLCEEGASLSIATGFLTNMDYIEELKFTNCDLGGIPAAAFSGVGSLDMLSFENGTVSSMSDDMLDGVIIRRNTSSTPAFPKHNGAFKMVNTKYTGTFPPAVFANQKVYEVVLRNTNLFNVDAGLFSSAPNVRYLDLSYNSFSELPEKILTDLSKSLGVIRLYGTDIQCTCDKLWFLDHVTSNYLTLEGDIVCVNTGAEWDGIALVGACLTPIDIVGYAVGFIGFVLGWVVLGLTDHTRRQMNGVAGNKKPGTKKKAPAAKQPDV